MNLIDSRFKFHMHMIQLSLIALLILLSIIHLAIAPPQRAYIIGIPIGLKSTIFILYQVLTEHRLKFQKWANPKINYILNCIDIPFWVVVMGLVFAASGKSCTGGACGVSWIMGFLALALLILSFWVATVTYREYRQYREKTKQPTSQYNSYGYNENV